MASSSSSRKRERKSTKKRVVIWREDNRRLRHAIINAQRVVDQTYTEDSFKLRSETETIMRVDELYSVNEQGMESDIEPEGESCIVNNEGNEGPLHANGLEVPKDARRILKFPRNVETSPMGLGNFCYLGLKPALLRALKEVKPSHKELKLMVNIDGLPLFKSSSTQIWPILVKFDSSPPYIVALYAGEGHPENLGDFLKDFLEESTVLSEEGVFYEDVQYSVKLWLMICDAPARAYLKCIKSHTGYYACERCVVEGDYDGRMVFHEINSASRTNDKFNSMEYSDDHQKGSSPFVEVGFPCVTNFVICYMHLVFLGVVRRFLMFLLKGPLECRLPALQASVSQNLISFGKLPSKFVRQPRSLDEIKRFKATELRTFLLYTGIAVLKGNVQNSVYKHFLKLSIAVRILLQPECTPENIEFARKLLKKYVNDASEIYGNTYTTYKVHNLIHIADDVEMHKLDLNCISAFPFENYLQEIKRFVKSCHNAVVQITKRVGEIETVGKKAQKL